MAGQKSSVKLVKGVPLIGGIAGGTLDAVGCRIVGKHARKLFETPEGSDPPKKRVPRRAGSPLNRTASAKPTENRPAKESSAKKSASTKPPSAKRGLGKKAAGTTKSAGSKKSSGAKKTTASTKRH
jgi:hypothetical protein